MTKYTKGPWNITTGISLPFGQSYLFNDERRGNQISYEEIEANRKLIACAPDMLETLQDVLRILELKPTNDNLYQRNKIKSLIQKAIQ